MFRESVGAGEVGPETFEQALGLLFAKGIEFCQALCARSSTAKSSADVVSNFECGHRFVFRVVV